ncbi:NTP transferase domain-containing protein [candidate division KSB3 bacterium]|uniref:NTP transferase domain-containing protein n=1 Tax=candidate division KSB3 bacterium TaxID=2044937 RepID=A0A9D5JUA5_9BACT|nr:NTP transferase domain-containing protein [candidate division KSB3 bacterium]MBD3324220.1 NTP transferase domain-containing protein [candidate division KSB3 bacterium]
MSSRSFRFTRELGYRKKWEKKRMKILIMCGGRGKRLGKFTETLPKPLVKITEKSLLEFKLEEYLRQGFHEFIFCIGYKGDLIRKTVMKFSDVARMEFSDAGIEAGILERLYAARDLFTDHVLMTYGDTFTDMELEEFCTIHQTSENDATIVVAPIENPFGLVEFDRNYQVTYFKEKPVLNYYIGYAIINKSAFDFISSKVITMPNGEGLVTFYKILMAMNKLGVYYHPGLQVTFNTPEELVEAKNKIIRFYTTNETTYAQ